MKSTRDLILGEVRCSYINHLFYPRFSTLFIKWLRFLVLITLLVKTEKRHQCFTGKYTTRKIHTKLHPGLEWRIFHVLTTKDIDDSCLVNCT